MPNNPVYVFDGKLCKFEGMTKEQILNAIYEATGVMPQDVDEGFISTIVETNRSRSIHVWSGTMAEYNALPTYDANTLYFIDGDSTIDDLEAAIQNLNDELTDTKGDVTELHDIIDISNTDFQRVTSRSSGSYSVKTQLSEGLYLVKAEDSSELGNRYFYTLIYIEHVNYNAKGVSASYTYNDTHIYNIEYEKNGEDERKLVLMRYTGIAGGQGSEVVGYDIWVKKIGL